MSTLTILRTDTVFAKLPIHTLTKSVPIDIRIHQTNAQGVQDLYWSVSPSAAYGAPQLLAYKLDTLVINRHLDTLKRPLPSLICLGSLRQIYHDLGQSRGKSTSDLKRAFHQNAGVYITAKLHYRDLEGKQRRLEAGFHRYGVVFTGESLPDGSMADAVYVILHETYRQVLNSAPTRPMDYNYLKGLKPLAQRFYELLSFKMFAALKYRHPQVLMRYSDLCRFAPQHRHTDGSEMSKQMSRVHQPHQLSGYLTQVRTERVVDPEGCPDWLLHYTPGPKAHAEYQVFTRSHRDSSSSVLVAAETDEPEATVSDGAGVESLESPSTEGRTTPATALVRQFYQSIHGVADLTPQAKEIEHATHLIETHGWEFATFFVDFACQTARRSEFTPHVFGGLMRYEGSALAAYQRQQTQQQRAAAEVAEVREAYLKQQYERDCRAQLETYRASLSPETLTRLEEKVRTDLIAQEEIPRSLLDVRLKAELHDQLTLQAGVLSYEVWLRQREETSHG